MRRDSQSRIVSDCLFEQQRGALRSWGRRKAARCTGFQKDESGAVAIIFGVTLIPLAAMMGLALDYSRVSLGRAELQAAVDSAGLAAAQLPRDTPIATIQQKAQEWVESNLAGKNLGDVRVTAVKNGTNITFRAEGAVGMSLFSLLRKEAVPLAASNEVTWDLGKVEIALVLDNTGSMASNNKLSNLVTAANKLVDTLRAAVTKTGQVRIGIVPFSSAVRLASTTTEKNAYMTQPWLAQHTLSPVNREIFWDTSKSTTSNPNRFDLFKDIGVSWGGCVEGRPIPYDVQDTPPGTSDPKTLFVPFFAPDEPDKANGYSYPNNYLPDELNSSQPFKARQGNDKKYDQSPSSSGVGPNVGCSLLPILRLSTDLEPAGAVKTRINQMTATGDTNIPLGLMWGWHLLSPHLPLADGVAYDTDNVTKYIILMTDGDNTYGRISNDENKNKSYYTSLGYVWQRRLGNTTDDPSASSRNSLMNNRLKALCANLRKEPAAGQPRTSSAPGIQVYAIGVGVNSTTKKLLSDCAYKPDMYYDVTNASDMTSVFTRIADEISQLRLSK